MATTNYGIPTLAGSDLARDIDTLVTAALDDIDAKMVGYSQGPLASRPVSTGGTPGIAGRRYRATDTAQEFVDTGTSWVDITPATLLVPYQTIAEAWTGFGSVQTAGTWLPATGTGVPSRSATDSSVFPLTFSLTPTDYAVAGLTTMFRVVAAVQTNAVAPAMNFTMGLHLVSASGGTGATNTTLAAAIAGSTVTRTAPAATSRFQDASADFAAPAAGVYSFGIVTSGTPAANSMTGISLRLEVHHV